MHTEAKTLALATEVSLGTVVYICNAILFIQSDRGLILQACGKYIKKSRCVVKMTKKTKFICYDIGPNPSFNSVVRMAERSKALDLGSSISGCVGSNPTSHNTILSFVAAYHFHLNVGLSGKPYDWL